VYVCVFAHGNKSIYRSRTLRKSVTGEWRENQEGSVYASRERTRVKELFGQLDWDYDYKKERSR